MKCGMRRAVCEIAAACSFVLAFSCAVEAKVPTKDACDAARAKLAELTSDDYKALKAKAKTNEETGDVILSYVSSDDKTAVKFLLYQAAYEQYILGMSFEKADGVYDVACSTEGAEYAQAVVCPMATKLSGLATSKRPVAKALKTRITNDAQTLKRVMSAKKALGKDPGSEELCERLAVACIEIGDWGSALASCMTISGEIGKVAEWELSKTKNSDLSADKIATFWWNYSERYAKQKRIACQMKSHAATWYRVAISEGSFKGVDEKLAEKRIAEAESCDLQLPVKNAESSKDLIHRWSFAGNLKDSVGKIKCETQGDVTTIKQSCKLNHGALTMPNVLSKDEQKSFTVEIWFTEDQKTYGSRVVILGNTLWASGSRKRNEGYFWSCGAQSRGTACQGFEVGHRNYIAISVKETPKGSLVRAFKCDLTNGKSVEPFEVEGKVGIIDTMILGWSCQNNVDNCSIATYEEVRVWKRAFSIEDVQASIKSGPDHLPPLQ